jgi:glycine dehydrogenase
MTALRLAAIRRSGKAISTAGFSTQTVRPILSSTWICSTCRITPSRLRAAPALAFSTSQLRLDPATTVEKVKDKNLGPYEDLYPRLDSFAHRHIGPDSSETTQMLKSLSPPAKTLDEFVAQVIPADILSNTELPFTAISEAQLAKHGAKLANLNQVENWFIGAGYYSTITPEVIKRNVLENPAWYTSYTPYQPEISQGRLESLLNYQTLVSDLTGLPVSNASLLDEGTAAAEAMTMSLNALSASRAKRPGKTYVVSHLTHPQTISVIKGRAEGFGIAIKVMDVTAPESAEQIKVLGQDLVGVLVQYPDTRGGVTDFKSLSDLVHSQKALLSVATDLLALTVLAPPGEWGADIAFGNAQRFGVPMGGGGPHAAFFAVKEAHKRRMPGRLVGVSKDRLGERALRLALQTREQHIRREKATSNVCTAQALLANMSALYAIYHGPQGLKDIANRVMRGARLLQEAAKFYGYETDASSLDSEGRVLFDTVILKGDNQHLAAAALDFKIALRSFPDGEVGISVGEAATSSQLLDIITVLSKFASKNQREAPESVLKKLGNKIDADISATLPEAVKRTSKYLTHKVFNSHHSETELLRYIYHLQSKDLSLVHSMIPLGSCTMKLNGSTEMALITQPGFSDFHPLAAGNEGYEAIASDLDEQLTSITGMDWLYLQPNSGAQGEFAGLRVIRRYHENQPGAKRDICLIPVSAHGTNPASAAMAGMRVVPVQCDSKTGNLDLADLEAKCEQYAEELGAIMITYPSTYGVFEPNIKKVCQIVHDFGGLVYMDGANMNAQIGLCSPGEIGADVCHLNLHKTFCIPHGGGGPGVGPICGKEFLEPYLPGHKPSDPHPMISSASLGSAGILPISWAYNHLMGML